MRKMILRQENAGKLKRITKNISLFLLENIVNSAEGLVLAFLDQKALWRKIRGDGFVVERFSERINYLEKQGYIEIDDNNSIRITNKGRIVRLEKSINCVKDGKWRLLSFDIPEKQKIQRNKFRRSIKRIGYKQVQKSLWVCPYVKADEIDLLVDEYKIREFVAYFVVEKTDIEDYLVSLFKE